MNVNKLKQEDGDFPTPLKQIASVPKELYVIGDLTPLTQTKAISIVGSRAVTPYGRQVTARLAEELAQRGIAIVSGLAIGVDAIAHQAALNAGGYTVAVLPGGWDKVYPISHIHLAERIVQSGGALITEYPAGMPALKQNFIARNRLVSGLSDGLLITEASEQSGTLHTANFALEQGKVVMAVPGNITSPTSAGTNTLIKSGATPVTDVNDILNALGFAGDTQAANVMGANAEEAIVLELMKRGMSDINELQNSSELAPEAFSQTITMLEITGKIRPLGAGHWGIK